MLSRYNEDRYLIYSENLFLQQFNQSVNPSINKTRGFNQSFTYANSKFLKKLPRLCILTFNIEEDRFTLDFKVMSRYSIANSTTIIASSGFFDSLQYQYIGIVDTWQYHSCSQIVITILLQYLPLQSKNEVTIKLFSE